MSQTEIDCFTKAVSSAKHYLEYGAGGSTALAARSPSIQTICSVESDPAFLASAVSTDPSVQEAVHSKRLKFLTADIGPTGDWGIPKDGAKIHLWPNYALCPFMHGNPTPDLVLIDGRFRVACCLVAAMEAPSATLLVHDYTLRSGYQVLEAFFDIEQTVDTLVKFRRGPRFNERIARNALRHYLYSPNDESQTPRARLGRKLSRIRHRLVGR
jgi:hypothetical protein